MISKGFTTKVDFLIIGVLLLSFPPFFYKLGDSSLVSWDEAWYGTIARNILETKNPINLIWNGRDYFDHPPFGFLVMAASFLLFGVNEFSTRLPSAVSSLLVLIFVYLLGKHFFNRAVGFSAAIATLSAPWFLFRARSGNLDILLTFLFIATFYFAIKLVREKKFLVPFILSINFLTLTKTAVPLTIIPALLVIFWRTKIWSVRNLSLIFGLSLAPLGLYFLYHLIQTEGFLERVFFIGAPGIGARADFLSNLELFKLYLHSGVGKWFWPGVTCVLLGLLTRQKSLLTLSIFFIFFSLPFMFSSKGHIWHLIPLFPVLALSFFGFLYFFLGFFLKGDKKIYQSLFLLGIAIYFSYFQIKSSWQQFINVPTYTSDEKILSLEAKNYPCKLYIDGDFDPAATFYSEKNVTKINIDQIKGIFEKESAFLMITPNWTLDKLGIPQSRYSIIKSDRDKILILKK